MGLFSNPTAERITSKTATGLHFRRKRETITNQIWKDGRRFDF